jgi:hypothetical protein
MLGDLSRGSEVPFGSLRKFLLDLMLQQWGGGGTTGECLPTAHKVS